MIVVFTAPHKPLVVSLFFLWSWKVKGDTEISSVSHVVFHIKKANLSNIDIFFLRILKIELPYDTVIPLLGIYLKKIKHQFKNIYAPPGHCIIIFSSQVIDATCGSTDE